MAFRDDRDALRARAERAEEQLAEANRALEALRAAPRSPPADAPPADAPPADAPPSDAPPLAEPPAGRSPWIRRAAMLASVGGAFALYLELGVAHVAEVTWRATVKIGGGAVATDAPCTVRSHLRSNGSSRVIARVEVRCGDVVLYPGDRTFGGWSALRARRCGVWEGAAPGGQPGVYHYRLDCTDPGALALDTARNALSATDAAGHHVELTVDTYSEPRRGAPLYDGNSPATGASFAAFERTGKVRTTSRPDQVPLGAACTLRVEPAFTRSHNCRLELRCAGRTLYGAGNNGFTRCELDGGRPVRAHDGRGTAAEGDPILHMDLPAAKVDASDDVPGAPDVAIALDPIEKAP
jgi:hypothetical protein